jgi:hypothetical protein
MIKSDPNFYYRVFNIKENSYIDSGNFRKFYNCEASAKAKITMFCDLKKEFKPVNIGGAKGVLTVKKYTNDDFRIDKFKRTI